MKNKRTLRSFISAVLAAVTMFSMATVYTSAVTVGDVNGDGKINLADVSFILKDIAGWDSVELNRTAADVVSDGKVNLKDVSMLLKHIAKWDGLEPLPELGDVLDLEGVEPVKHSDLGYDDNYSNNCKGEYFMSYYEEPIESFLGVCKYHENNGYELYGYNVLNGNHFATYVKGEKLAHIYWIECESELNVAISDNCGEAMPPKTPAMTTGEYKTSVTQLQSTEDNGMGYAVQLADGSFILYDGGYANRADEMWNTLVALNGNEDNIVIRAWLITHSHNDHYQCFSEFSNKYADKVTLERVMISPISKEDMGGDTYLHDGVKEDIQKFEGAKILYVHTGMTFNFCNVNMEILFAPEELYISDSRWGSGLVNLIDNNSSSVVSRVYTDDYSAIFLGDATNHVANRMLIYYGDYLKSDMCQAAHHGWESWPLIGYRRIQASIMWYPTSQACYDYAGSEDVSDIRKAVRESKYTEEVIVHEHSRETRYFAE